MNKEKRVKLRIIRSKVKRLKRKNARMKPFDSFDKVITYQNFYDALCNCQHGVMWKGTVQRYTQNCVLNIDGTIDSLKQRVLPKLQNTKKITIMERGKQRTITPIKIEDRITQRVLCDNALVPAITPTLIYDNGASMKGKGVDFTRKEVMKHLTEAVREYGTDFYVLAFDFKSYFDSITHKSCLEVLKKNFKDRSIIGLCMSIIRSYQTQDIEELPDSPEKQEQLFKLKHHQGVGICLGSQISQVMALAVPNVIDHYIKDVMSVRHYIRYMDDGIIISDDKEFLHRLYDSLKILANDIDLRFNEKKTRVIKITKGFTFLKVRYFVEESGKIIRNLPRSGIVRQRRKLRKFKKKVDKGDMTLDDVYNSMQSWLSHSKYVNCFHTKNNMLKLYKKLFDGYKIPSKKKKEDKSSEILRTDKWSQFRWGWD